MDLQPATPAMSTSTDSAKPARVIPGQIIVYSLMFRISAFIILVMVGALLLFSLVFILSERSRYAADIVRQGEVFANFSNKAIYDDYVQYYTHPSPEDFETFKQRLQATLANNDDVVGVSLMGRNGRILFDSGEMTSGKYTGEARSVADGQTARMLGEERVTSRTLRLTSGQDVTEIVIPLREQSGPHLFSMRYLVSNRSLTVRMQEVYLQIAIVIIPLTLLVVFMVVVFTRRLVAPIRSLTSTVEKFREGQIDARSDIVSRDEIGVLAGVFNHMAATLGDSYKELEANVASRTAELNQKLGELEQMNKMMIGREVKMTELKKRIAELEASAGKP